MIEEESLVSLGNGTCISLSGAPIGQKESAGSFVMVGIGCFERPLRAHSSCYYYVSVRAVPCAFPR